MTTDLRKTAKRSIRRLGVVAAVASAALAFTAPVATASAAGVTSTPTRQTVTSGGVATWRITATSDDGRVVLDFGDGTSTTHAQGTFTVSHRYTLCTAHTKNRYVNFIVRNGPGSIASIPIVTVKYSGPLCV